MLNSSLCDYTDAYILVKGTITVNNTPAYLKIVLRSFLQLVK